MTKNPTIIFDEFRRKNKNADRAYHVSDQYMTDKPVCVPLVPTNEPPMYKGENLVTPVFSSRVLR